jgi:hypothetical protein
MGGEGGKREGGREGGAGDWAPKPKPVVVLFFFLANAERILKNERRGACAAWAV